MILFILVIVPPTSKSFPSLDKIEFYFVIFVKEDLTPYILDFFCEAARLSVELDGLGHGHPRQQAHDAARTKFLVTQGIKGLRFWNHQVRRNAEGVRAMIFQSLQERASHPFPDYTRPLS